MRTFILKTIVITIAIYILFQFTLGQVINDISSKFKLVSNHHQRIEIKTKITTATSFSMSVSSGC